MMKPRMIEQKRSEFFDNNSLRGFRSPCLSSRTPNMKTKLTRFTLALVLTLGAHTRDTCAAGLAPTEEQAIYQRAFDAVLWALPVADTLAPRRAGNERGISPSAMFITEQRPTGKMGIVTMNAESPCVFGDLTTEAGPIVFEVPPRSDKARFSGSIV